MKTVFDGIFQSMFSIGDLSPPGTHGIERDTSFAGQVNGLVGTAVPSVILLTFGLNTGPVRLTIQLLDSAPAIEDWDEIVESSLSMPTEAVLSLNECCGDAVGELCLAAGAYRARYCAKNFAVAEGLEDPVDDSGEPIERYLLSIWPAPFTADEVIKSTSKVAEHWHLVAQGKAR